jgi:hypothetical protein
METFKIEIREFLSEIVEIDAESADEAYLKAKEMYCNGEIVLDENNYISTEIENYIE